MREALAPAFAPMALCAAGRSRRSNTSTAQVARPTARSVR